MACTVEIVGYAVEYGEPALDRLARLDAKTASRITSRVEAIAENPRARNPNIKPLVGVHGFRLRVGDWRVLFALDHHAERVLVRDIRIRGAAYSRRRRR